MIRSGSKEGEEENKERALTPYVHPQQTAFSSLIDSNQNYLSYVPTCSIKIEIFNLLDMERKFLSMVPVKRIILGKQIGRGGTNSVHLIDYEDGSTLDGMLIKDAGASSGRSREFEALKSMESIGLRSVARGLMQIGSKQMLVMDYINGGIDSKSIIGYMDVLKDYINPDKNDPAPKPEFSNYIKAGTIRDLLYGWERMVMKNKNFSDFQFLIDREGNVIYNDPTSVSDHAPRNTTRMIIQAMIDTWEFKNCVVVPNMSWKEFKQYKKEGWNKMRSVFPSIYRSKCSLPVFHLIDWSVFEGRNVAEYSSIFFTGEHEKTLPGWTQTRLNGRFGYFITTNDIFRIIITQSFSTALNHIQVLQSLINSKK